MISLNYGFLFRMWVLILQTNELLLFLISFLFYRLHEYKTYQSGNSRNIIQFSGCEYMLNKYLEFRGINKNTMLTSPMTGRTFSIERLITTIELFGKGQTLISTIEVLPFRNDSNLLLSYLTGIGEGYLVKNAL